MTSHDNVTDIVERLNCEGDLCSNEGSYDISILLHEAAAVIESREKDLATLRKQLENAREALQTIVATFEEDERQGYRSADKTFALDTAREALKGQPC